jgi:hypothetical protein
MTEHRGTVARSDPRKISRAGREQTADEGG